MDDCFECLGTQDLIFIFNILVFELNTIMKKML